MKANSLVFYVALILLFVSFKIDKTNGNVEFYHDEINKKVDVFINAKHFTSFIYPDSIEKQVLYPILSTSGQTITRGYPLNPRPFESIDHPHHIGLWFNFGDVNGLDFWNNTSAIKPELKHKYGSIRFVTIKKTDPYTGELITISNWVDSKGNILLEEQTTFIFSEINNIRSIERISLLTAKQQKVVFTENKEGLLGLRVDRAFEEPSNKPQILLDLNGNQTQTPVLNNEGVNGLYRNAEGVTGGDVWGKKSKWVALSAKKNEEIITIIMMDHYKNPYDFAWSHARGYGLFAINNLGGRAMDVDSQPVKIELRNEDRITFKYKIVIGGELTDKQIDEMFDSFNYGK